MARNEDLWTAEKRRQSYVALGIAAREEAAATRTLAYYVRIAMAHGMTAAEVCAAGDMLPEKVAKLSDPFGSVA